MSTSFRLGTLFGFPVRVHLSFVLLLGAVLFWMGGLPGVFLMLMVAGSVLLHELGHALLARHLGVPVAGIGLHFFGGAAEMVGLPRRPGDEIAIAAAGPAVSFALAGLGHGLSAVTGIPALALFGSVNLALGAFNLLPAFPSDGGRILRAWLARRHGLVRATELAVNVGRVVCVGLALIGLAIGSFQLVAVAAVLWMAASAERLSARLRGNHGDWRGLGPVIRAPVEYLPRAPRHDATSVKNGRPTIFVWRF